LRARTPRPREPCRGGNRDQLATPHSPVSRSASEVSRKRRRSMPGR
jgi:hypothetical protein